MKRLLVTGGTGYLGGEIVRRATSLRWSVMTTWHHRPPGEDADWIEMELADESSVERAVREAAPDVVIHTAFVQHGDLLDEVTARGAARVARAAAAAGAMLVHLSTDVVFSGSRDVPYREVDPVSPVHAYGRAKADAERLVVADHPAPLVVRTSLLYGGTDGPPGPQERLVADAVAGRVNVSFYTDEVRNPVVVSDLATALLELADRGPGAIGGGIIHLGGDDTVSRHEFAVLLAEAAGLDSARLRRGTSADKGENRPRRCALDNTLARAELETRLRGVREVLGAFPPRRRP
jgi:dTDP-4-dehydrorhamnose reductase